MRHATPFLRYLFVNAKRVNCVMTEVTEGAGVRIFVVDDNECVADLISIVLCRAGFQVVTFYDALPALHHALDAPICQPKGGPPVTFQQIQAAKQKLPVGEGAAAAVPDLAKLAAIIREAGIEQANAQHQSVGEALKAVRGIDQFLTTTLGSSKTISFGDLEQTLQQMLAELQPYLVGAAGEAGAAGSAAGFQASGADSAAKTEVGGIAVRGVIRSRDQVVQAIDSICEYYKQVEPSSPVPYLLRRAQKLARMDFVEAMQELKLATVDSLRPSMGSTVETEGDKKGG